MVNGRFLVKETRWARSSFVMAFTSLSGFMPDKMTICSASLAGNKPFNAFLNCLFFSCEKSRKSLASSCSSVSAGFKSIKAESGFLSSFLTILLLALNALAVLIFILYQGTSAVVFSNVFAYGIYFLLHLVIAGVLLLHSVNKWKLSYNSLLILFFMASSLPVWAMFI